MELLIASIRNNRDLITNELSGRSQHVKAQEVVFNNDKINRVSCDMFVADNNYIGFELSVMKSFGFFAHKDEAAAQSTFRHIQTSKAYIALKRKTQTYLSWTLDAVVTTLRVIRCRREIEHEIGRRVLKEQCETFFDMLYTSDGSAFGKSAE